MTGNHTEPRAQGRLCWLRIKVSKQFGSCCQCQCAPVAGMGWAVPWTPMDRAESAAHKNKVTPWYPLTRPFPAVPTAKKRDLPLHQPDHVTAPGRALSTRCSSENQTWCIQPLPHISVCYSGLSNSHVLEQRGISGRNLHRAVPGSNALIRN